MNYANISGQWINEFGSIMNITNVDAQTGIFWGTYSSHTGATGVYGFVGMTDYHPDPNLNSQTLSFAISWRSLQGPNDDTQHWISGFAGQYQLIDGTEVITTTYLMQKNSNPADNWGATIVDKATFKRYSAYTQSAETAFVWNIKKNISFPAPPSVNTSLAVLFNLHRGPLSNNGATPWISSVGIGSPAQSLRFMIDTGTDNTWVTSSDCTTEACLLHQSYNAAESKTYQIIDNTPTQKSFGPWGTMTVTIGADLFTLQISKNGNVTIGQTQEALDFQLAVNYSGSQFAELDCDGGIAVPSPFWVKTPNTQSLLLQLLADGKISYPVASFGVNSYMGLGQCLFGAVNPNFFKVSTLQWLSLKKVQTLGLEYLWDIDLSAFLVNGQAVSAGITDFVLDTGSSYFKGPADLINALVYAVTYGGQLPTSVHNSADLQNYPLITLNIGTQSYNLTPAQYFLEISSQEYVLGIQVLDGMPDGMLLVGSVFLDTVYSIFDYQAGYIGLALYE